MVVVVVLRRREGYRGCVCFEAKCVLGLHVSLLIIGTVFREGGCSIYLVTDRLQ